MKRSLGGLLELDLVAEGFELAHEASGELALVDGVEVAYAPVKKD